eukprot:TRINITY_DN1037_c0_g1_i1.p1 TRINITY_DN1037_c0_g1~~TRINITY_DN1037_c0_g1_i1.p1  ORF type:complete len:157 (+),score=11.13 TRINITY_DN1037_c0_g1_i1:180-650(+)
MNRAPSFIWAPCWRFLKLCSVAVTLLRVHRPYECLMHTAHHIARTQCAVVHAALPPLSLMHHTSHMLTPNHARGAGNSLQTPAAPPGTALASARAPWPAQRRRRKCMLQTYAVRRCAAHADSAAHCVTRAANATPMPHSHDVQPRAANCAPCAARA